MIEDHMDVLHKCAEVLIQKEKIGTDEFEAMFLETNGDSEN